jgi:hypothetical protein
MINAGDALALGPGKIRRLQRAPNLRAFGFIPLPRRGEVLRLPRQVGVDLGRGGLNAAHGRETFEESLQQRSSAARSVAGSSRHRAANPAGHARCAVGLDLTAYGAWLRRRRTTINPNLPIGSKWCVSDNERESMSATGKA